MQVFDARRGAARAWGLCLISFGLLTGSAAAESASSPSADTSKETLLPPGARSPEARSDVREEQAGYGFRLVEAKAGEPEIEYTVDPELESWIAARLESDSIDLAHVVLMDPRSGEVFAYLSTDAERFPATRAYPMASLMKVVTAAALLESQPEAVEEPCRSVGNPYLLEETHLGGGGHADEAALPQGGAAGNDPSEAWVGSFRTALAISNNQCFARYAVADLGEERLLREVELVGLREPPAPGHAPGHADPGVEDLDLGYLGSGLGGSAVTPLGAAQLAAMLATGKRVEPWWIAEERGHDGLPRAPRPTPRFEPGWEPELAEELRELLLGVVEEGTARRAFRGKDGAPLLGEVGVAGKTGTLRGDEPAGLYQWFVGVAPADAPTLAVAALVLHPDEAERTRSASDVAAAVVEHVFCGSGGACRGEHARRLRARADARDAERAQRVAQRAEVARVFEAPLDEVPRVSESREISLPQRLRRKPAEGRVVLAIELGTEGDVLDAQVTSSDLPEAFGEHLADAVLDWRFTPPRRLGRPVHARVEIAMPVVVEVR